MLSKLKSLETKAAGLASLDTFNSQMDVLLGPVPILFCGHVLFSLASELLTQTSKGIFLKAKWRNPVGWKLLFIIHWLSFTAFRSLAVVETEMCATAERNSNDVCYMLEPPTPISLSVSQYVQYIQDVCVWVCARVCTLCMTVCMHVLIL